MFVSTAFAQTATESQPAPAAGEHGAADAVHTETGVAQDAGHGSGVFPPFDSTHYASQLLWLAITFGLFYLFMSRVVLPRIGGVIETRRDRIAQDLEQAARLKQDADNAIVAYEQELAQARTGLRSVRALAAHPGLPESLRSKLGELVDEQIPRLQAQLEQNLEDEARRGADARFVERRRRTLRDNALTAVLKSPEAAPAPPADPWASYAPGAPTRRRVLPD